MPTNVAVAIASVTVKLPGFLLKKRVFILIILCIYECVLYARVCRYRPRSGDQTRTWFYIVTLHLIP